MIKCLNNLKLMALKKPYIKNILIPASIGCFGAILGALFHGILGISFGLILGFVFGQMLFM